MTETVSPARVRLPAARRRRQLLDVALRVFADRGFDGTSMSDLAEEAGVTKPVLYQHFGSKRALFLELLDDVGRQLEETVSEATAGAGGPRQQVEAGFASYFRFVVENRSAFQLLLGGSSRRDPEFAAAAEQVEQAMATAIADLIGPDIGAEHRRTLSYALVGMAEGVSHRCLNGPDGDPVDPEALGRRVAELAWAGLRGVTAD